MDEAATSGAVWFAHAGRAPRHTVLGLTGGAIGQGLPTAVGAAIACPERKVIALQADGSGMYTAQALWTMARESLDVVVVLCANRAYRILQIEVARAGIAEPGPAARALTELSHPALDWCALARGMGVPAVRATDADSFAKELADALAEPGPALIEALAVGGAAHEREDPPRSASRSAPSRSAAASERARQAGFDSDRGLGAGAGRGSSCAAPSSKRRSRTRSTRATSSSSPPTCASGCRVAPKPRPRGE